jgi:hypothetical protein
LDCNDHPYDKADKYFFYATTSIAFGDGGIAIFSDAPCLHELKPIAPSMFSISSRKNFTVKKGNAR